MPDAITYLVANHDQARYVGECLASLRAQTDDRWRAVVLDDASTDDSLDVIARYLDDRVLLVRHTTNQGYIAALRRLIDEAPTDVVAIVDADDALAPDATARLLDAFTAHPGAALVYSRFAACDETLTRTRAVHGSPLPPGGWSLWHATVGHVLGFRRSAYRRTAGLDDAMLYAEDRDLVYKLEEVAPPVFVDAVLYRYREVPGSQSRDPAKRRVGAANTRRARLAALTRRGVRGRRRLLWATAFLADYVAATSPRARVRAAATRVLHALGPWLAADR